ncbi:hypothetical protein NDU88_005205 [Pleurodeles waltl]|uniref:Uncharacterized protein n=1 Tax=Pleurodeles waltl TaxID=8319 RepID=A0AAV7NQS6_PLEWA|nr:hypothetical protein NDU88_005205 [Pleurodeles waltl]
MPALYACNDYKQILIFPPMDTTSQEHLQKWEANLKLASINMIKQLIEISEEAYEKHRKEVDNLTQCTEEANWGEITTKSYAILNSIIDRYEEDIIQRKYRKFRRDLHDYQHGRVYTFGKKYDNIKDSNLSLDTQICPDNLPSSEYESSDDSDRCLLSRPQVDFSEEARRYRLGTLKDIRAKPLARSQSVSSLDNGRHFADVFAIWLEKALAYAPEGRNTCWLSFSVFVGSPFCCTLTGSYLFSAIKPEVEQLQFSV